MASRTAAPFVLADFPESNGRAERRSFTNPREVIVAHTMGEVRPALERVARNAAEGRWAAGYVAYDAAPAFDAALRVAGRAPTLAGATRGHPSAHGTLPSAVLPPAK